MGEIKKIYEQYFSGEINLDTLITKIAEDYIERNYLYSFARKLKFCKGNINGENQNNMIMGLYDPNDYSITLSHKNIQFIVGKPVIDDKMKKNSNSEYIIYFYLRILFHELTHAKQEEIIEKELYSKYHYIILTSENYLNNKPLKLYKTYHNLYPVEHHAEVISTEESIRFNSKYQRSFKSPTINYINKLLNDYALTDNKVISPIERLNKKSYSNEVNNLIENRNLYDLLTRLEYGLPISLNEYKVIKLKEISSMDIDDCRAKIKQLSIIIK